MRHEEWERADALVRHVDGVDEDVDEQAREIRERRIAERAYELGAEPCLRCAGGDDRRCTFVGEADVCAEMRKRKRAVFERVPYGSDIEEDVRIPVGQMKPQIRREREMIIPLELLLGAVLMDEYRR